MVWADEWFKVKLSDLLKPQSCFTAQGKRGEEPGGVGSGYGSFPLVKEWRRKGEAKSSKKVEMWVLHSQMDESGQVSGGAAADVHLCFLSTQDMSG